MWKSLKCIYEWNIDIFFKITTEHMTVLCRTTQVLLYIQLKLYKELKHNYFYWTLLQTFLNPFLYVVHISNRLSWEVFSQYIQYRMCFPFADTCGKESVAQQQMIISVNFPPFLLPLPFWRHNVGVVKQSKEHACSHLPMRNLGAFKELLN